MKIRHVLLTGVTGFLGSHILSDLIQEKDVKVYCLVRATDQYHAKERISETLKGYGFFSLLKEIDKKIIPLIGDLEKEKLGIEDSEFLDELKYNGLIINAAAFVKHFSIKEEFEKINIYGVQQLINLALETNSYFVYISTTAVAMSGNFSKINIFTEESKIPEDKLTPHLYVRSKIIGENLVLKASKEGLFASIIRVGFLTGRYTDGVFQKNESENGLYARLKIIIKSGVMPKLMYNDELEMTPVDECSRAIQIILKNIKRDQTIIYHIYNNRTISFGDFVKMLEPMGYSISIEEIVDYKSFRERLAKYDLRQEIATGYHLLWRYQDSFNFRVSSEKSVQYLNSFGFHWPKIDAAYLNKIIKNMRI